MLPLAHLEMLLDPIVPSTYRQDSDAFGEPPKQEVRLERWPGVLSVFLLGFLKLKLENLLLLVFASTKTVQ